MVNHLKHHKCSFINDDFLNVFFVYLSVNCGNVMTIFRAMTIEVYATYFLCDYDGYPNFDL